MKKKNLCLSIEFIIINYIFKLLIGSLITRNVPTKEAHYSNQWNILLEPPE